MNKAIEAAAEAVDLTAYAVYFASHGGKEKTEIENPEETARAAISAYLQALASDDEAVEVVARAMCVANGTDPDWPVTDENHPRWTIWVDEARAAIAALAGRVRREP